MSLKEKINSDLKEAMKAGDKLRLSTIRSIRALILDFEKSGANRELNAEEELLLITSAAKKRRDSIEQYRKADRTDLAEIEEKELEILSKYLPKQLTDEELEEEIRKLAAEIGASSKADFPKLMPLSAKTFKGKADGRKVKEIVDKVLS
ncbi:MAG: GatB/YqeY domain-containing protein [Melioribacteraceae bacterium]|nr:GatB/YqeY domain-containing protein [Melioribacteraceae bacterium]